jgi:hypothetical protein
MNRRRKDEEKNSTNERGIDGGKKQTRSLVWQNVPHCCHVHR